jgi:hypothetical protein
MQLGRRRGGLQIDDIRQALPVDTMTIEELADVVARLEEAGTANTVYARAASGHAAAAPPSAAINSRRLIVIGMFPSRARA